MPEKRRVSHRSPKSSRGSRMPASCPTPVSHADSTEGAVQWLSDAPRIDHPRMRNPPAHRQRAEDRADDATSSLSEPSLAGALRSCHLVRTSQPPVSFPSLRIRSSALYKGCEPSRLVLEIWHFHPLFQYFYDPDIPRSPGTDSKARNTPRDSREARKIYLFGFEALPSQSPIFKKTPSFQQRKSYLEPKYCPN